MMNAFGSRASYSSRAELRAYLFVIDLAKNLVKFLVNVLSIFFSEKFLFFK
jgi:hypothetical protein